MKTFFHILRTLVVLLIPIMLIGAILTFPKAAMIFFFLALVAVLTFLAWDITQ